MRLEVKPMVATIILWCLSKILDNKLATSSSKEPWSFNNGIFVLRLKKINLPLNNKEVTILKKPWSLYWSAPDGHFGPFGHMVYICWLTSLRWCYFIIFFFMVTSMSLKDMKTFSLFFASIASHGSWSYCFLGGNKG